MSELSFPRARLHPRWKSLLEPDGDQPTSPPEPIEPVTVTLPPPPPNPPPSGSAFGPNFSLQEQTLRNDYSQHFVDTGAGLLPGNAVRNPFQHTRFQEYPKLHRLVQLKDSLVTSVAHPPTYLCADLTRSLHLPRSSIIGGGSSSNNHSHSNDSASHPARDFHLSSLIPVKYDVVLIDPPLEAYEWDACPSASQPNQIWSWDEIAALPVPQVAAKESFVFLWVGTGAGDGLERGREVLAKWGYRRCEDIVWVRSNSADGSAQASSSSSSFTRSSQHCLMGIRGTVRRSTDTRFVHCNIDTDVIMWPGEHVQHVDASGRIVNIPDVKSKPPELYQIIENFCLGTRRLELFGRNRNLRRGWLTIGLELGAQYPDWPSDGIVPLPRSGLSILEQYNPDTSLDQFFNTLQHPREYNKAEYDSYFGVDRPGCDLRDRINLVPFLEEVNQLRPKSPPPRNHSTHSNGPRGTMRTPVVPPSTGMPSGLSSDPILRNASGPIGVYGFPPQFTSIPSGSLTLATNNNNNNHGGLIRAATIPAGGAGLSGLGAGGARTVSIPSGSDTLSGPQASVLKSKAAAEAAASAVVVVATCGAP